ncbi:MAG: J domain-containing protein [Flavobacteriales bacterium]|nr:J domain-containing protein [Flavobacteriales bacterium]
MPKTLRYDHYVLLGIPRGANEQQIKQAYRERVKRCHPDRDPSPQATKLFRAVHEAYTELMDPARRTIYDERLRHYRPSNSASSTIRTTQPGRGRSRSGRTEADRPVNRVAFLGLHITGLCFGVSLVSGILLGIVFLDWPPIALLFCAPGLAIIPDSWSGIRPE